MDPEAPKEHKKVTMSIDDVLLEVGQYGKFQKIINGIFCFMALPPVYQIMMMYFAANNPDWKCSFNSSICTSNESFPHTDRSRCSMHRSDWDYVKPPQYSLVTQFDIHCKTEWIIELLISIYFLGWIVGSIVLGWFADNYGRKNVIFVSMGVIIIVGFATPFLPSIYLIVFCRFIIGIFTPGTYQQMFTIMNEIVGGKKRAFAGNMIFVFVTSSMAILGLKAYFIREWKLLYIVCTAPYIFVLLFYKIIPKSVRYLAVKGEEKELIATFERIAHYNKTKMPANISIAMPTVTHHKSNPLDLFRTRYLAKITLTHSLSYIVGGVTFYGLYLAAGDIGGSMYRDYVIVTCTEIPFALYAIDLSDRIGRKRTTIVFFVITAASCFGLSFTPMVGKLKIARIVLGMLGKCCCGAGYNTVQTWTMELYPTYIRGEGVGFLQVLTRVGAACAPWVNEELYKIHKSANYIFYGVLTVISFFVLIPLKEIKGQMAAEDAGKSTKDMPATATYENDAAIEETDCSEFKEKHTDKNGFTHIEMHVVPNGNAHIEKALPNGNACIDESRMVDEDVNENSGINNGSEYENNEDENKCSDGVKSSGHRINVEAEEDVNSNIKDKKKEMNPNDDKNDNSYVNYAMLNDELHSQFPNETNKTESA